MSRLHLSEIHIYPIKSLGGISLQEANMEERGLQYDRRWMLVDAHNEFLTQRKHFSLALLQVNIVMDRMVVSHKTIKDEYISFSPYEHIGEKIPVRIWDDVCSAVEVNSNVSDWFSEYLNMRVKLVKMPDEVKRQVDPKFVSSDQIVGFADDYPSLIIGQASLDALNERLASPVPMNRFRPNFVFTGGEPHMEDHLNQFNIGNVLFSAVKPCARCVLTTIDQQTGMKGREPLRTLAKYRTFDNKVMFGQNLIHWGQGILRVGDELKIGN